MPPTDQRRNDLTSRTGLETKPLTEHSSKYSRTTMADLLAPRWRVDIHPTCRESPAKEILFGHFSLSSSY